MTTPHGSDDPPPDPSRGLFLTLDGPDGGGKTTQAAILAAWLRARGREVVSCRDPGGTALGDRLRALLLDRGSVDLGLDAEMLLYMASRAQLLEEVIRPALARGSVVVSDRYLLANIVYQGFAGGLGVDRVGRIGGDAAGNLLPDLTIVLDVPPEVARARIGPARDRIEDRPEVYQAKVRDGFLQAARGGVEAGSGPPYYPGRVVLVEANGDREAVSARIRNEVERVLEIGPRA